MKVLESTAADSLKELEREFLEGELTKEKLKKLLLKMDSLKKQIHLQNDLIHGLKQQARRDALTGALNRRAFEQELNKSLSLFKRYNHHGALLMIDVNDFKTINDTLGHLAGDAILKHIVEVLERNTRDTDMIFRVGGDEFCVILKEMTGSASQKKQRELMDTLASSPCSFEGRDIYITVSIGACAFAQATTKADLIAKADTEMYSCKQQKSKHLSALRA